MMLLISYITLLLSGLFPGAVEYTNLIPDSRVVIDYNTTVCNKPVVLVFFALPNGNTIEWTAGKRMAEGDDWHYDIQHIKAQTEFVRKSDTTKCYIVAYLQASMKAWTAHAGKYNGERGVQGSYNLYPKLIDSLERIVSNKIGSAVSELALVSHSGGGRFMFDYISGVKEIPSKVSRLSFIDSSYGFETPLHTDKLVKWLKDSPKHNLAVISYVDTTVIFNGKKIVSSKGGTGYKTEEMYVSIKESDEWADTGENGWGFSRTADTCFVKMSSDNGRLLMLKKENPQGNIYHTVLVERNGFIHSIFFNSPFEDRGYEFWVHGRAYENLIK